MNKIRLSIRIGSPNGEEAWSRGKEATLVRRTLAHSKTEGITMFTRTPAYPEREGITMLTS